MFESDKSMSSRDKSTDDIEFFELTSDAEDFTEVDDYRKKNIDGNVRELLSISEESEDIEESGDNSSPDVLFEQLVEILYMKCRYLFSEPTSTHTDPEWVYTLCRPDTLNRKVGVGRIEITNKDIPFKMYRYDVLGDNLIDKKTLTCDVRVNRMNPEQCIKFSKTITRPIVRDMLGMIIMHKMVPSYDIFLHIGYIENDCNIYFSLVCRRMDSDLSRLKEERLCYPDIKTVFKDVVLQCRALESMDLYNTDIKVDNIVVKRHEGRLSGYLIDYDSLISKNKIPEVSSLMFATDKTHLGKTFDKLCHKNAIYLSILFCVDRKIFSGIAHGIYEAMRLIKHSKVFNSILVRTSADSILDSMLSLGIKTCDETAELIGLMSVKGVPSIYSIIYNM